MPSEDPWQVGSACQEESRANACLREARREERRSRLTAATTTSTKRRIRRMK